eukprot:3461184-Amphidinium_carterae.1
MKNGKRPCYTEDPRKADLFFVPVFLGSMLHEEFMIARNAQRRCVGRTVELAAALKYLTWNTTHKHVFAMGRMADGWFYNACLRSLDVDSPGERDAKALLSAVPVWGQERQWPHGMQTEFLGGYRSK